MEQPSSSCWLPSSHSSGGSSWPSPQELLAPVEVEASGPELGSGPLVARDVAAVVAVVRVESSSWPGRP